MSIDYEKVSEYLKCVKSIEKDLDKHQELFDPEKLIEFRQLTYSLQQNMEVAQSDSRKLSIGIVGAVKAGKSSFLNACIFGGEEYLPKAATPMTAALTKISYSDKPKAIVHFYTTEDWDTIEKQATMYDEALQKEYEEYIERISVQNSQTAYGGGSIYIPPMSKEEFEKGFKCKSENQRGAKELIRMAIDPTLMDKLGGTDEIEGDIITKLDDYVGANGHFTPIVSYVELQVDNPYVKDFEIVDTPGLNDPIVSRGIRTKQFLRSCDVVLLLSPCSQFMDARTVNLMASSLPNAGVREILVVGSKLDSGILNESSKSFGMAYKKSLTSYKTQFIRNLEEAKKSGKHLDILDKMSPEKVLFVSSTCFAITQKKNQGQPLDDNEQKVYDNLHQFEDFEDKYLTSLGGISKVQAALNEVLTRKIEIIEGKNSEMLDTTKNNHLRILEKILQETVSSRSKLETTSAEELKQRTTNIRDIIDSSRSKLMYIFDGAVIKCDEKVQQILPQLTVEMGRHQKIAVKSTTTDEHTTEGVGLFGWKKEIVYYTVTNNSADTSSVIENIKQYSAKCHTFVNSEFKNIFNKEEFANKIKDVVLAAFNQSQKEFDEDDILLPLQNVLAKISIPHIGFDYTPYIDEVETRFKSGYAQNEDIHQLTNLQSRLLDQIEVEIAKQLVDALKGITTTLKKQAVSFADQIENDFCTELEKLQKQVEEREHYIEAYHNFADVVKKMKAQIS
ncbi:MAG: dynamin family protein [Lachnospiraceae bacterium]|nr:dynamin family protein [Lachnospiraceae bacterium]